MENIIELNNVHKYYGKGDGLVKALNGATLDIKKGEMCAVMGKSGSGKSTLLYVMAGLNKVDKGDYSFQGKPVNLKNPNALSRFRKENIGLVVQNFALIEDQTVFYNVALPLKYKGMGRKRIQKRVMKVLEMLEIADKAKNYPGQLSGGQQQRVSIARALVKKAEVLLADEPTGSVDEATEDNIMALFRKINTELGKTIVIVTHDEKVGNLCDRIIRLSDGRVVNT
ncbi:MAG TPA: ABC transporter ATP-binding protein [Oscillospiraceae bacterium]|nr:ABC transporter ATP-binding protein [Oscillospiraceae bacterium]HPK34740.1 ABC transporter ATP-binding protein [Oscillospiraceae bacterium]